MNSLTRRLFALVLGTFAASAFADSSGTEKFGDYLVHYSALSTQILNEQMAAQYSIERSPKHGLVNLSVQKVAADETATAVAATIRGEAVNLTGQKTPVVIREIPDLYVSYIGLFDVVAPDTYTFEFSIRPEGSDKDFTLRFNKNFVAE